MLLLQDQTDPSQLGPDVEERLHHEGDIVFGHRSRMPALSDARKVSVRG